MGTATAHLGRHGARVVWRIRAPRCVRVSKVQLRSVRDDDDTLRHVDLGAVVRVLVRVC